MDEFTAKNLSISHKYNFGVIVLKKIGVFLSLCLGLLFGILMFNGFKSESFVKSDTYSAYVVANKALDAISKCDYKSLSEYIHPTKGIVFTPFSYVNCDENLVFTAAQVSNFATDNDKYIWGVYDQSSVSIEATVRDYFERFVYDKNFLYANQIGINSIIRQGNSIENVIDEFPDSVFVDFYDSGSEEYDGLDWSSLKIVMEKCNGEFKIVAIIHSSYTL